MRIVKPAIFCSLLAVILADTVVADEAFVPILRQPTSVRQAAFDYDNQLYFSPQEAASESPSDQPAADEPLSAEAGCGAACDDSCGKSCGSCGCCCNLGDPCTLPQPCFLASRGITVGGWVSAGIYGNTRAAPNNGPLGLNDRGDGFTMNQLWVYVERATDTGGYGTDLGFRFDYVFGVDGPDTQARGDGGWDFGWNSSRDYGSAIPQLYLEFAVDDLTIKFGHFYTLIGWEVVPAPDNFFYSHAYTMSYAEPFTHTGFLASYAVNDDVMAYGGWTTGWDTGFDDLNEASTFLGGLSFVLSDDMSFTWALTAGDFGAGISGLADTGDIYMNSLVLEYQVTDKLTYILQHDFGQNSNIPVTTNWYGINQYLQYAFNDCVAGGLRFEWFRDDNGARVRRSDNAAAARGDFYEITAGINYRPHANVVFRPEIRFDWFEGAVAGFNGPFGRTGQFTDQVSGGFDFIVTY